MLLAKLSCSLYFAPFVALYCNSWNCDNYRESNQGKKQILLLKINQRELLATTFEWVIEEKIQYYSKYQQFDSIKKSILNTNIVFAWLYH